MSFVSLKKNFLSLIVFCCLAMNPLHMYAGQEAGFRCDEREYIYALANEIEGIVDFFQASIAKFIDPADHTPYKKLALSMSDKVTEFEQRVMMSLAAQLAAAKTGNSPVFYKSLGLVSEILNEFLIKINELRVILIKPEYLNAHDGVKAIKLGKELEGHCKDLLDGKLLAKFECKLDQIFKLVSAAGEQTLSERLSEIKMLLQNLKSASMQKKGGNNELRVVNGITAKIRHNK